MPTMEKMFAAQLAGTLRDAEHCESESLKAPRNLQCDVRSKIQNLLQTTTSYAIFWTMVSQLVIICLVLKTGQHLYQTQMFKAIQKTV